MFTLVIHMQPQIFLLLLDMVEQREMVLLAARAMRQPVEEVVQGQQAAPADLCMQRAWLAK
jgi:hypothetical protein